MDCREASQLIDLWLDDALADADAHALEDHLATCPSCAADCKRLRTESRLLEEAMQAALGTEAEIRRIEGQVMARTVSWRSPLTSALDVTAPILGAILGMLVLFVGRFDGAEVREVVVRALTFRGGYPVSMASLLIAVSCVVFVLLMIQALLLSGTRSAGSSH